MQMANFMVLPFMASFQIIKFCKSLSVWLANKTVNDWFADRTRNLIDLVLSEVEKQKNYYSARLALQYAITELTCPAIINGTPPVRENNSEFDLSDEAQKEYEFLKIKDALPLNANLKLLKQEIPSRIDEEREEDLSLLGDDDQESLNHVINYANKHDAILEYYYMDDNHEMHLCEIFGVDHPEKRHLCHTHLGTNNLLNSSDSTESNCNCNRSLNA